MHAILFRCFGLLLVLGCLSCPEAAPSQHMDKEAVEQPKAEQLVRVYPINEEQYERLLKLTDGKNVISEARLTSAGFTSVRNTLDSGWNSLLRIIGLTTTSRSEVPKIDIDGQPLCVMQRSLSDDGKLVKSEPRDLEARAASENDSVINCIVVLKRDPALESLSSSNPDFAPYWYHENEPIEQQKEQQTTAEETEQIAAPEKPTATAAPKVMKFKNKKRNKSKSTSGSSAVDAPSSRQYGSPYGIPPPPPAPYGGGYGSPFGSPIPYGGYNQNPYQAFNQFNPYSSYAQQPPFGPQPPFGQQPYYPQEYYGQSPTYNPYPYYEQNEDEGEEEAEAEDEEDEEDDEFAENLEAEVAFNSSYEDDYYD